MGDMLTVEDVKSRLPFKISGRALRQRLRQSGLVIEHRRQIALQAKDWERFLETLKCSGSSNVQTPRTGKWSGRALTPESALEKARAVIAKTRRAKS